MYKYGVGGNEVKIDANEAIAKKEQAGERSTKKKNHLLKMFIVL